MADHILAWKQLWRRFDLYIQPVGPAFKLNGLMLLRLNLFHLLQTVSHNSIGLDIGVPARGWTGEAYQGHIFWDELFIFPFFNFRMPEISRSLLMYRYRRWARRGPPLRPPDTRERCSPGRAEAMVRRRPKRLT